MKNKIIVLSALMSALALPTAHAEITQDCILEGTVDKRKAEQMGRPVYVSFRRAEHGDEASCDMARRNKSRRVQFKAPSSEGLKDAPHGSKVTYRYIERNNADDEWQLVEMDERR